MAIQHCHSAEKTSGSTMLNSRWREVIEREGDIRVVKLIKKNIQKRYNKNKVEMLSRIRNPHQGRDHRVKRKFVSVCTVSKSFHVNACFMQMPCMCYPFPIPNAYEAFHTCHGMYCINVYVYSCIANPVM